MANRNQVALDADYTSYGKAVAVTPSDSTDLGVTKGLYVGGVTAGQLLSLEMADGTVVSFVNPAQGAILPLRVQKVRAATTATNIVALY